MKTIRILEIELHNIFGVEFSKINFDGENATIQGASEQGKSTLQKAIDVFIDNYKGTDMYPTDNGYVIPNKDGFVSLKLLIDGNENIWSRTFKQNEWTKRKNSDDDTLCYNGHKNNSCIFNGLPCNLTNFIEQIVKVTGAIKKEYLPFVFVAYHFCSLDSKIQRKYLWQLLNLNSIIEQLDNSSKYSLIKPYFKDVNGEKRETSDILKMLNQEITDNSSAKNGLGQRKERINFDIDRTEKLISDFGNIDGIEIQSRINKIRKQIDKLQTASKAENKNSVVAEKLEEISKLRSKLLETERKQSIAKQTYEQEKNKAYNLARENANKWQAIERELPQLISKVEQLNKQIINIESEQLDNSKTVCPTCHRELESEKIAEIKNSFESNKQQRIESVKKQISTYQNQIEIYNADLEPLKAEYKALKGNYEQICNNEPIFNSEHITSLESNIARLNDEIKNIKVSEVNVKINEKLEALKEEESQLIKQLGKLDIKLDYEKQVEKMKIELLEIEDAIAINKEKKSQLNAYVIESCSLVNDTVNSNFNKVTFRLFQATQAKTENEGSEDCEAMLGKSGYNSGLSTGAKCTVDFYVTEGLQNIIGINGFIFADERQSNTIECISNRQVIELQTRDEQEMKAHDKGILKTRYNRIKIADYCKMIPKNLTNKTLAELPKGE